MPDKLRQYNTREDGFTLIELLIVVLIIGVLAAIAIPVYLGIQNQSYKSAVRGDVNISVKRVQVALTEGKDITAVKADQGSYTQKSVAGETVFIAASTNASAGSNDLNLTGSVSTTATPTAGPINYSYAYDSVTGQFTDGDAANNIPNTVSITTTTLPNGYVNDQYNQQVAVTSTGGAPTYAATGLPTPLTIDPSTGVISGSPATAGTYNVTITATNGTATSTQAYTLNVITRPVITTASLPNLTLNTGYTRTLATSSSPAVTSFTLASGALPTGLTFDTTLGKISGTPTANGTYTFTIYATNANADSLPRTYTIVVGSAAVITTTTIPNPVLGTYYSATLATTGYPSPTFALKTGSVLPAGLNLDTATGTISGIPTGGPGFNPFSITATNTLGNNTANYNVMIDGNNIAASGQTTATNMPTSFTTVSTRNTSFYGSRQLVVDSSGNSYVITTGAQLFKIAPDGTKTTFVGGGAVAGYRDGTGTGTNGPAFANINSIAIDSSNNIYVADYASSTTQTAIRKITPAGVVTTLAVYQDANMTYPNIAIGPDGSFYLASSKANSPVGIIKVDATGNITTVFDGSGGGWTISDITVTNTGAIYFTNTNFTANVNNLGYRVTGKTTAAAIGSGNYPAYNVISDNNGNLYFGSGGNNSVYKYGIAAVSVTRYTTAGTTGADGPITGSGGFNYPNEVFASNGKLYFIDGYGIRYLS